MATQPRLVSLSTNDILSQPLICCSGLHGAAIHRLVICHAVREQVVPKLTGARYDGAMSDLIKTRLSNSFLIGEIFGMLAFGAVIDRLGRRTGVVWATFFLVLGIVLATAAHGKSYEGCV